jgi:hypothetical protein
VHVLSNGRRFTDMNFCSEIARLNLADLMIGIPVYSSVPEIHNFVVQAENAWDETIQGILNLRRFGIPVEIRIVLHSQTCNTLVRTADFICRTSALSRADAALCRDFAKGSEYCSAPRAARHFGAGSAITSEGMRKVLLYGSRSAAYCRRAWALNSGV